MSRSHFDLIQHYITGWKDNNLENIISCLTTDCIIIESHGPTYYGIQAIKDWFKLWLAANSSVLKWDISSFYDVEQQHTAVCEWDFACVSSSIEYTLQGASIVKFSNNKIAFIHEHRMTCPAYRWDGQKLQSE